MPVAGSNFAGLEPSQHIRIRQLSEITGSIQRLVTTHFQDKRYWVVAEITDYQYYQGKGHHYMSLVEKDEHGHQLIAKVQAAAWAAGDQQIRAFQQATGQRFGNHIQVLLRVSVDYHPVYGLKFVVLDVDVKFTLGKLELQRRETMQRLAAESPHVSWVNGELRSSNQRLAMRPVVQRIALLVSRVSAGYEDFMHSLENNVHGYRFSVTRFYVPVQGGNAAALCAELTAINSRKDEFDVVIMLRGGGAQTDFLLFDDFDLCKTVAAMRMPLITGLGHQRNQSISDMLAHTALKTPTQVAEHILQHNRRFEEELMELKQTISFMADEKLRNIGQQLEWTRSNIILNAKGLLRDQQVRLKTVKQQLAHDAQRSIQGSGFELREQAALVTHQVKKNLDQKQQAIKLMKIELSLQTKHLLKQSRGQLAHFLTIFQLMDPQRLLKRGFAIIYRDDEPVTSALALHSGETIRVQLKDGSLDARVLNAVPAVNQNKEEDDNRK